MGKNGKILYNKGDFGKILDLNSKQNFLFISWIKKIRKHKVKAS